MSNRDKVLIALTLVIIALLAVGIYLLSDKIATLETNMRNIASNQNAMPKVINGIDGENGADGLSGKNGLSGSNGIDGKDSLSTYVKETTFERVPLAGVDGIPGKDAPMQQIQVNKETGNLETKREDWEFWTVLVPCEQLMKSCPTVAKPEETL